MSEVNGTGRENATEITGNVVDILAEFNKNKSPSRPEVTQEATEPIVAAEDTATKEETTVKADATKAEVIDWIIENKFKDDADGRAALAKSYRELQSLSDKKSEEYKGKDKHYEGLGELEEWLIANPEAVHLIKDKYSGENALEVPQKPEGFDALDIGVEGTVTDKWFQEVQDYGIKKGEIQAKAEVNALRSELEGKEAARLAKIDEEKSLVAAGLAESEIDEYSSFMRNPDMASKDNLVKIYRMLSGKDVAGGDAQPNTQDSESLVKKANKTVSAAAVGGNTPVATRETERKENAIAGIMKHAKRS